MSVFSSVLTARLALAGLAGAGTFAAPSLAQQGDPIAIEEEAPAAFVPGEVIVRFRAGTSTETRDQVLALVGGNFVRSLGLEDTILVSVPAGTEIAATESLGVDPNVVHAEPNGIVETNAAE